MRSIINELWHGNIVPQEDSRTNSKEMKELLGYMSRHHEDLEKSFTDEQKEIFEKFHDCWSEYASLAEAAINIAYRWFLWINLDEPVPDHSTFLSFAAVNSTAQHCLRTFLSRLFASASRRDLLPANFFSPILPMSELTQETICTKLLLSQTSRAPISND